MHALCVKQPWAWLLFHGKPVENRNWHTSYKGSLAIAASAGLTWPEYRDAVEFVAAFDRELAMQIPMPRELVRGCVIGTVEQVGCVEIHPSPFFQGPYGHIYESPREFARPCPARGALGFWEWNPVGGIEQYLEGRLRL